MECDSLVLVQLLKRLRHCSCSIFNEVQQFFQLESHFIEVQHCLREAYQVANSLSNIGSTHMGFRIHDQLVKLPKIARGAPRLDKLGFPTLRNINSN